MVLEYSCKDNSAFIAMGKHLKEVKWKVAALGCPALDIQLNVEKQPLLEPDVGVICGKDKLYPAGAGDRGKMKEDFEFKWPFRGQAIDLSKPNFWEVRPKMMGDNWFPATSVKQNRDGTFEAVVWLPDGAGGAKQIIMQAVEKEAIREERTKKPLELPYRTVVLDVPKADPLEQTTLTLKDEALTETVTHYFARPTPPPSPQSESMPGPGDIQIAVSKDRKNIATKATHSVLALYMMTEARSVSAVADGKTKVTWKFRLGPLAEHTVVLEKTLVGQSAALMGSGGSALGVKQVSDLALQQSQVVCLSVDGKVLVEAAADDFDSGCAEAGASAWASTFRFLGERSVKFLVYETNGSGLTLETTDLVEGLRPEQVKISKACTVCVKELADLSTAALSIDGVAFHDLRPHAPAAEPLLAGDPQVLEMQYGIRAPWKVRDVAPLAALQEKLQAGGTALSSMLKENWEKSQPGFQAFGGKLHEGMGQLWGQVNNSPMNPAASGAPGKPGAVESFHL